MTKFQKIIGYTWASPLTALGVAYAGLFSLLKWYKYVGVKGDVLVWAVDRKKSPTWLLNIWKTWAGHAIGNVVVLKVPLEEKPYILVHEQNHAHQCMRLGVFQPILYALSYFAIKFGCTDSDPYYDGPFEIDSRRVAGQIVDVVGVLKKKGETAKVKL